MSKASRKSLSFSQPFGMNDLTSFFRESMRPSLDNNQIDLNHKLINNYNRFSVGGTEDKVYKINIVSAEIKEDDVVRILNHTRNIKLLSTITLQCLARE
jgi:hypothetical protein